MEMVSRCEWLCYISGTMTIERVFSSFFFRPVIFCQFLVVFSEWMFLIINFFRIFSSNLPNYHFFFWSMDFIINWYMRGKVDTCELWNLRMKRSKENWTKKQNSNTNHIVSMRHILEWIWWSHSLTAINGIQLVFDRNKWFHIQYSKHANHSNSKLYHR